MQRIAFVVLASLGAATVCLAQDTARMEHVVQSYMSSGTFAGSVLVAHGSDVIVSKGYGLANVEWNIPSTPSARFKVASITKQFTAAAILLLEERGRLKVDDLVKTHLPDAPAAWDRITLFHLLTHTAGSDAQPFAAVVMTMPGRHLICRAMAAFQRVVPLRHPPHNGRHDSLGRDSEARPRHTRGG